MADVRPFRGFRYDPAKQADLSRLMSPPYDVIGADLQQDLYDRSPYGIVRIDYGKEMPGDDEQSNRYSRAAALFDQWKREGVFLRDDRACIYYVEEDYRGEFGKARTRTGFVAAVGVEDAESGVYRPHEKTLAGPKADRLKLTQACRANLSSVFSLYDDPKGEIDAAFAGWKAVNDAAPAMEVVGDDGVKVRLWPVTDEAVIDVVRRVMEPESFFIADGHHRYETALNYRNIMSRANPDSTGDEPWNFVMMYLVNLWSPGLTVLPAHRAVFGLENFNADEFFKSLEPYFEVETIDGDAWAVLEQLEEQRAEGQAIGVLARGEGLFRIIRPKPDMDREQLFSNRAPVLHNLDVTLLHGLLIERILGVDEKAQEQQLNLRYVKEAAELARQVRAGEADIGFFLNPTPVEQVKSVAESGERMPQKSTYFYPKLVTGLVLNPLFDEE